MDIKKIIKRVEVMKTEVAGIRKEVDAEAKRILKLRAKGELAVRKLEEHVTRLAAEHDSLGDPKVATKVAALRKKIGSICVYDNAYLGTEDDFGDESVIGALRELSEILDNLVSKRGKLLEGRLVRYAQDLALDEKLSDE